MDIFFETDNQVLKLRNKNDIHKVRNQAFLLDIVNL